MPRIISIDPGVSGTGYAVWDMLAWDRKQLVPPIEAKNLYHRYKSINPTDKVREILASLVDVCERHCITHVICETPEYFDTVGGNMVAKTGDLVTLAKFVGAIEGVCFCKNYEIEYVLPRTWKGQLTKEMVKNRVLKILPEISSTSHALDAIGIGLWKQGFFNIR
jgi:Holliday junction resolvasome RuvABC endonuclease subunit